MRILVDESLPRRLSRLLAGHEARTVAEMRWTGLANGALLRLAAVEFDAFLTADRNLEHQQNLAELPIAVVVLIGSTNRLEDLRPLVPRLLQAFGTLRPRQLIYVGA